MATIGSLTADLSLKAATFIRDLDRATDSVRRSSRDMERHASQIQRGFDRAGAAVKSFGVGLASAIGVGSVAGVARLSKDTLNAAGNLGEMATAAGLATRELQALQFAGVQVGVSQEELVRSMGQFANRVGEALRGMIPLSVRQSITRCLPRSIRYQLNTKWMNADIDWARTRAFCIPNSNEGYFRINLEGREPRGNVAPGDSYRQLVRSLRTELDGLVNPASGRRCWRPRDRRDFRRPGTAASAGRGHQLGLRCRGAGPGPGAVIRADQRPAEL
jgi:hypothetical protein